MLLELFEPRPLLVIFGVAEIPLAGEEVDRLSGRVDVLRERVAEEPFAPIAVLNAAADRGNALGLQLVAGAEEIIPRLGRIFGVESRLFEQIFVVAPDHRQRIPAEPVDIAAEMAKQCRVGGSEHVVFDETVQRPEVAEPHAFHVIDAVPQVLDVGRFAGSGGRLELGYDDRRVLQHRLDSRCLIVLDRVVDECLETGQFLFAPPPHVQCLRIRPRRQRRQQAAQCRAGAKAGGPLQKFPA